MVGLRFSLQTCEALLAERQAADAEGQCLSLDESLRVQAINSAARRRQFLAGRWLAKTMLCETLGGTPAAWRISADPRTKPRVLDHDVQISIAHSGDYVACAIADEAVGIDLERTNVRRRVIDMAQWVCSTEEQLSLSGLQGDVLQLQFNRLWTRKEARLKQHGQPFDLAALRAIQAMPVEKVGADGGTWCFSPLGLVVSLAANDVRELHVRWPIHWQVDPVHWYRYV